MSLGCTVTIGASKSNGIATNGHQTAVRIQITTAHSKIDQIDRVFVRSDAQNKIAWPNRTEISQTHADKHTPTPNTKTDTNAHISYKYTNKRIQLHQCPDAQTRTYKYTNAQMHKHTHKHKNA